MESEHISKCCHFLAEYFDSIFLKSNICENRLIQQTFVIIFDQIRPTIWECLIWNWNVCVVTIIRLLFVPWSIQRLRSLRYSDKCKQWILIQAKTLVIKHIVVIFTLSSQIPCGRKETDWSRLPDDYFGIKTFGNRLNFRFLLKDQIFIEIIEESYADGSLNIL